MLTSSGVQVAQRLGARLQATAEQKDDGAEEDGLLPPEVITHRSGEAATDEGPAGEDRHDRAGLTFGRVEEGDEVVGGDGLGWGHSFSIPSYLSSVSYLSDDTEIIPVKDRSQRGEDTNQELKGSSAIQSGPGMIREVLT